MWKVNFSKKKIRYSLLINFCLLYNPGMRQCYNTLLSNFRSIISQVVLYGRLQIMESNNQFSFKSCRSHSPEVVTYRRGGRNGRLDCNFHFHHSNNSSFDAIFNLIIKAAFTCMHASTFSHQTYFTCK